MKQLPPPTSLKVLIFTDTDTAQINGVQLCIDNLRANLANSIELKIISPDNFWYFALPYYREIHFSLVFSRQIQVILQRYKPHYIHIATEGPVGFVAAKVCKKLRIPYTSAFHTKLPEYIHLRNKYIPSSYVHTFLKYVHDGSQKIFISNHSLKKYLKKNLYTHLAVIPFGIDHAVFCPGLKTYFQDLPKPLLLCVGRIAIEKNIEDFLKIKTLGTKLVVGDGPLREKLEKQYPESLFLGYKTKGELAKIYRSADLFIMPSKTDTLGLVNLEALACGLPVLAYDVDGPRGVIESGKTGILVPENESLVDGVDRALQLVPSDCIKAMTRYTWQSYATKFIEQQSLISKNQGF